MKKDWIARELTVEIVVGAFVVMILLGLGHFTIILSGEKLRGEKYRLEAVFQDIMGLREGDSVVVRGMPIGKVRTLALTKDGVQVTATLDEPVRMKADYRVSVVTTSMLGGRYLEVQEGSEGAQEILPGTILQGAPVHDLMADAAALFNKARLALVEGGVIENLKVAAAQVRDITERLNKGEGSMGRLLSSDDTLYADISASVASLKGVAERLEKGEGTIGKLLSSDDSLYRDLSASMASLRGVTDRIDKGEGTAGRLLSKDDKLYEDLSATVASLKHIAQQMEAGKGTVGRLLMDESLYDDVKSVVNETRATLDDFRETAPITTFSSIFFGAF